MGTVVACGPIDAPVDDSTSSPPATPDDPSATPEPTADDEAVITVAGVDVDGLNASASGYVTGVIEDGGECTFTFTGAEGETSATSTGAANATTTSCGLVQVPMSELSRGTWQVVLTYSSDTLTVVSQPMTLEIP